MKKLTVFLIAISFCILSAGGVFANEPDPLSRHSVWSSWWDEKGNRLPDTIDKMKADRETTQRTTSNLSESTRMGDKGKVFDFIQETKTYDYSKDKGRST